MPEPVKSVYDTNIMVSGAITFGLPHLTLLLVRHGRVKLYISSPLLSEYRRVLSRPEFQAARNIRLVLEVIERYSNLVIPTVTLNVTLDPSDNRVVECAVTAPAEYIVTGNKRHFPFYSYEGIKIVNAREFLSEVAPEDLERYERLRYYDYG